MTLRELEKGDIFINTSDKRKNPKKFLVKGHVFDGPAGRPTRLCIDLSTLEEVSKSAGINVTKTGESIHKQKMLSA